MKLKKSNKDWTIKKRFVNKKGQLGDAMDMFFTIFIFMVLALFFGFTFMVLSKSREVQTISLLDDVRLNTEVITNLYYQLYQDKDLSDINLNVIISNVKVLKGEVIRVCLDYNLEIDCKQDVMKISSTGCSWQDNKCAIKNG